MKNDTKAKQNLLKLMDIIPSTSYLHSVVKRHRSEEAMVTMLVIEVLRLYKKEFDSPLYTVFSEFINSNPSIGTPIGSISTGRSILWLSDRERVQGDKRKTLDLQRDAL